MIGIVTVNVNISKKMMHNIGKIICHAECKIIHLSCTFGSSQTEKPAK